MPITPNSRSPVARKLSSDPVRTHVCAPPSSTRQGYLRAGAARQPRCASYPDHGAMAEDEDLHLIGPDEIAYRLDLTASQLKIVHTALHSLLDDLGHDERDVGSIVRKVLDKLPDEHSIRAIDIRRG